MAGIPRGEPLWTAKPNLVQESCPGQFLKQARLLVLEEAHVYDGAFRTSMAS
jgi:hypothetical protein